MRLHVHTYVHMYTSMYANKRVDSTTRRRRRREEEKGKLMQTILLNQFLYVEKEKNPSIN